MEIYVIIFAIILTLSPVIYLTCINFADLIFLPRIKFEGEFIAEVWIEWEVYRGSTMYRQRFKTRTGAKIASKIHAWILDQALPSHYVAEYSDGRPYKEVYPYEIKYGVRGRVRANLRDAEPIWTTAMPGTKEYCGEPSMTHPVFGDPR
jgi:hypothetical protein